MTKHRQDHNDEMTIYCPSDGKKLGYYITLAELVKEAKAGGKKKVR